MIKNFRFCRKEMCVFSNKVVTKYEIHFSIWPNYAKMNTVECDKHMSNTNKKMNDFKQKCLFLF